jgi:hypothetical protein
MPFTLARERAGSLVVLLAGLVAALGIALALVRASAPELPSTAQDGELREEGTYGKLPLAFEPNAGRGDPRIDFIARSAAL